VNTAFTNKTAALALATACYTDLIAVGAKAAPISALTMSNNFLIEQ